MPVSPIQLNRKGGFRDVNIEFLGRNDGPDIVTKGNAKRGYELLDLYLWFGVVVDTYRAPASMMRARFLPKHTMKGTDNLNLTLGPAIEGPGVAVRPRMRVVGSNAGEVLRGAEALTIGSLLYTTRGATGAAKKMIGTNREVAMLSAGDSNRNLRADVDSTWEGIPIPVHRNDLGPQLLQV
jgi:hypothetical protein